MTPDNFDLDQGGVKFDAGKIRMDLVPPESIMAEAAVYTYGAIKYDDWNHAKGMRRGRLVAALLRHTMAYMLGEENDPESGLPHTWHMRCCTGMLVCADMRGHAEEDRHMNVAALDSVYTIFGQMNSPAGTVKNGGGSLSDHWADDLVDTPEEKDVLKEVLCTHKTREWPGYPGNEHEPFMDLFKPEWDVLCAIDGEKDWPGMDVQFIAKIQAVLIHKKLIKRVDRNMDRTPTNYVTTGLGERFLLARKEVLKAKSP